MRRFVSIEVVYPVRGIRTLVAKMRFVLRMTATVDVQIAETMELITAEIALKLLLRSAVNVLNVSIQIPSPFVHSRTV